MTTTALRALTLATCVSAAALLSACGTPNGGYYDANGNYNPTGSPYTIKEDKHSPLPGGVRPYDDENFRYRRAGYYDYNGYYLDRSTNMRVPESMLPPRGMCRVWFIERVAADQPGIESCDGIYSRVPVGAYVIFGG